MNYVKEIQPDAFGVFAGDKTNLIEHFNALRNDQRPSFNIWALLLGVYWLAYKKLYKLTAIYIAVFAIGLTINLGLAFVLAFAMNIALGFLGNKLFVEEASKHIHKISSIHTSEAARNNVLSKANKGSKLALIAVVCLMGGIMSLAKQTTLIDLTDVSSVEKKKMDISYYRYDAGGYMVTTPEYEVMVLPAYRTTVVTGDFAHKAEDGKELIVIPWKLKYLVDVLGNEKYKGLNLQTKDGDVIKVHDQCYSKKRWTKEDAKKTVQMFNVLLNQTSLTYTHCFEVEQGSGPYYVRLTTDRTVLLPLPTRR